MSRPSLVAFLLVLLGALAVLFAFDPAGHGFYPTCPTFTLFGLHCPGCGTLRAVHRLLHADVAGALRMNPLMVVALPVLLVGLWRTGEHNRGGRPLPALFTHPHATWGWAVVLVAYAVLRNLPWFPFTLLAPH